MPDNHDDARIRNPIISVYNTAYNGGTGAGGFALGTTSFASLLVGLTLAANAIPSITGGVGTFGTITGGTVVADGTAAEARFHEGAEDPSSSFIHDATAGTSAEVSLTDPDLVTGEDVESSGGTLTAAS